MTRIEPTIPIYRSIQEIPPGFGPTVAAIGNFDGVHLGHRSILGAAVDEVKRLRQQHPSAQAIAITFDPHPVQFLRPAEAPRLITPLQERLRLLATTGIDAALVLPFNAQLARLPARVFVEQVLVRQLDLRSLHEGANFHFGHGAEAGVGELMAFGKEFGFQLTIHKSVHVRTHPQTGRTGFEVSSSAIRECVTTGQLSLARWMLGRSFVLYSTSARGRGLGTRLVVPTVNLADRDDGLMPAIGVYVTCMEIAGHRFQAVTNVGNRPTFRGAGFAVESHLLNFEPIEINERTPVALEFLLRLRGEMEWPSADALKDQITQDVARARHYFRLAERAAG